MTEAQEAVLIACRTQRVPYRFIAEALGMSESHLRQVGAKLAPTRKNTHATPEEAKFIIRNRNELSVRRMADYLGRSRILVQNVLDKHDAKIKANMVVPRDEDSRHNSTRGIHSRNGARI